jgi:hypothetical protein
MTPLRASSRQFSEAHKPISFMFFVDAICCQHFPSELPVFTSDMPYFSLFFPSLNLFVHFGASCGQLV